MFEIIWKPEAARQIEKIKDSDTCKAIFKSIENLINFLSCINIKSLKNVVNSVQIVSIE